MKGIILAGGIGTRLYPVTNVINKHLLPIYNKPMIYYPLSILMLADIREILVISTSKDIEKFRELLGDGSHINIDISYAVQDEPNGIAEALIIGEEFAGDDMVCLILGDNIFFGHNLPNMLLDARKDVEQNGGAMVFGHYVNDPERSGVVEFDNEGRVISIEEKPQKPKSNYAVAGLYFYDRDAFKFAKGIKPSERGELEITSLNNEYVKKGNLKVKLLGRGFAWFDAGIHDSFLEAGTFIATLEKKIGLMLGSIEEVAFRKGWITSEGLKRLAEPYSKTEYGKYLLRVAEERSRGAI
jgi:glucose-1-phosphate thymidylyltransferase